MNIPNKSIEKYYIGVIACDTHDFKEWKVSNGFKPTNETLKIFEIYNTVYVRIEKEDDLCSISLNEILETERAKENPEYTQILNRAKQNMLQKGYIPGNRKAAEPSRVVENFLMYKNTMEINDIIFDFISTQESIVSTRMRMKNVETRFTTHGNEAGKNAVKTILQWLDPETQDAILNKMRNTDAWKYNIVLYRNDLIREAKSKPINDITHHDIRSTSMTQEEYDKAHYVTFVENNEQKIIKSRR